MNKTTEEQVYNQVMDQIYTQARVAIDQLHNIQIMRCHRSLISPYVGCNTHDKFSDQVRGRIRNHIIACVLEQLDKKNAIDRIREQTSEQFKCSIWQWDEIEKQIRKCVDIQVHGQVWNELSEQITEQVIRRVRNRIRTIVSEHPKINIWIE